MTIDNSMGELRMLSGARVTTHVAANDSSWDAGTATKLRHTAADVSSLVTEMVPDEAIQSDRYKDNPPLKVRDKGTFPFSVPFGGADSSIDVPASALVLSKLLGGIASPTARSATLDSSGVHTTTKFYASGIEAMVVVGQAVLINGEARRVTALGTDSVETDMALSAAPSDGDTATLSTTVYLDETETDYLSLLHIGDAAENQHNMISCWASELALSGSAVSEMLSIDATMNVDKFRIEPSGTRATLSTTAAEGNSPAPGGIGGLFLADQASTVRTAFEAGTLALPNMGVSNEAFLSHNGLNGVGAYVKTRPADGLKLTLTIAAQQDMPGLRDDLLAGTAKQLMVMFGDSATRCVAVDMQNGYVNLDPKQADVNGLSGWEVELIASIGPTTNALTKSPLRYHLF